MHEQVIINEWRSTFWKKDKYLTMLSSMLTESKVNNQTLFYRHNSLVMQSLIILSNNLKKKTREDYPLISSLMSLMIISSQRVKFWQS